MRQGIVPNDRQSEDGQVRARVFTQVSLTVRGENIFQELQRRVLNWTFDQKRNPHVKVTPQDKRRAREGKSFEINLEGSEYVAAEILENPKRWGLLLRERWKDRECIWATEVVISERESNEVDFGCRLTCSHRGHQDVLRSIPNFVRGIAFSQEAMLDGRLTSAKPWIVDSESSVDELVAFFKNPGREHPVVVFSLPVNSSDSEQTIIPVKPFLRRTVGYAHTVVITSDASFALTNRLGKGFSVYRQAVRTYNRRFEPDRDLPTDHPVATEARIKGWPISEKKKTSQGAFTDFLVDQTLRPKHSRKYLNDVQPSFQQIKRIAAEQVREAAKESGQGDIKLLELAFRETSEAKQEAKESEGLLAIAENERDQAQSDLQQIKAQNVHLLKYIESLEKQLTRVEQSTIPEIPTSLQNFEDWCEKHLTGAVTLHSRAFRGVEKSRYEDVSLIFKALLVLRNFYVPMKREGGPKRLEAFKKECRKLGIEEKLGITGKGGAGEQGDDYFIRYNGKRRLLEMHLRKGTQRDERKSFRLYFFWEEEERQVVVGWLPSHLRTRIT